MAKESVTRCQSRGSDQPATNNSDAENSTTAVGEETRSTGTSHWLATLRATIGLQGPTLRQTIEDALKSDTDDAGAFSNEERQMLRRLLRYGALRVEDVMVPRADIVAVDEAENVGAVLQQFVDAGVSRMPVYNDTLDDPRGMIHVKDLVGWLVGAVGAQSKGLKESPKSKAPTNTTNGANGHSDPATGAAVKNLDLSGIDLNQSLSSTRISRSVLFVPPSMPAMNLLLRMQSTRKHMAIVVDEYGGTDGLITIEDLVEQIVGEIEDEHDDDETRNIVVDPRLGLVASARTPVEELEERLGLSLADDEDTDIDTLGGLVFTLAGSVPVRGEIVRHPTGVEFEILDSDPRRIKRVKISRAVSANLNNKPGSAGEVTTVASAAEAKSEPEAPSGSAN